MSQDELELDPELQALQHQLDAAFAGIRPRPGFQDQLWARLERGRPWWRGLLTSPARWPLAGGAVAVLIVAGLLLSQLGHPPSHPATTSGAVRPNAGAAGPSSTVNGPNPRAVLPAQLCASSSPEGAAGSTPAASPTPAGRGAAPPTPRPTCTPAGR